MKDALAQPKNDFSVGPSLLTANTLLQDSFSLFYAHLVQEADKGLFKMLVPLMLDLAKHSKRISSNSALSIPDSLLIPSLLQEEPNEQIRDLLVARKVFGVLKMEFLKFQGNFIFETENSARFLVAAQRVLTLLYSPKPISTSIQTDLIVPKLLSKRYKKEEEEEQIPEELEALQRSVLIYTLNVVGSVLTSTITPHQAVISQALLLTRSMVGRGLFSANQTSSFLNLVGQHDAHLLEGLYWAQKLLLCGFHYLHPSSQITSTSTINNSSSSSSYSPYHSSTTTANNYNGDYMDGVEQQKTLIGQLCDKVPQLPLFLSVLNPYTLFVAFLDFLKYDHSIMLDFMLSSESEWFLKYLLDFVKFCLADWNRTFIALYNLKSKVIDSNQQGKRSTDEEVDSLLDYLLQKQMKEMQLDPTQSQSDNDNDSHSESSQDPILSSATDAMLANNSANQTTFDAVISCLIRLLFHLETASQHHLIGYNIEPLLARLREMECQYEKSDSPGSSTHR
jgi:hypothetical protein